MHMNAYRKLKTHLLLSQTVWEKIFDILGENNDHKYNIHIVKYSTFKFVSFVSVTFDCVLWPLSMKHVNIILSSSRRM